MNLGQENETLEFKKSTGELKEGLQSIVAILNKHGGGELYFGVRNDGEVCGQEVTEQTLRKIAQEISNKIEPKIFPEIRKLIFDEKAVAHVSFTGDNVPYFVDGRAYIRVADSDKQMPPEKLTEYILNKNTAKKPWDRSPSNKTIDDVDEKLLKNYVKQANEVERIDFKYTNKQEVLERLGAIEDGKLTNAARIMFCQNVDIEVQMATFATNERLTFTDIRREHGSILDLIRIAEKYIKDTMRWRVEFDGSLERKEIPEVPVKAIREALVNSFCHRDYLIPQTNEVAIFKDRIEIYNAGTFPEGLTPNDFIEGSARSYKRNEQLAQLLYYPKEVESFGTGFKRIKNACDEIGAEFTFEKHKYGFALIFHRKEIEYSGVTDKMTDKMTDKNSSREKQIMEYLSKNEFITNKIVCNLCEVSDATSKRLLKEMTDKGLLDAVGERKARKYILKK